MKKINLYTSIISVGVVRVQGVGLGAGQGRAVLSGPGLHGRSPVGLGHPGHGLLHSTIQRVLGIGRVPVAACHPRGRCCQRLGRWCRHVWVLRLGRAPAPMLLWRVDCVSVEVGVLKEDELPDLLNAC